MESEHVRFLGVLLLHLTVAPGLLGVASAQSVLGQTRNLSLVYIVSYQGSLQPRGSISFLNTFYIINGSGTNMRITSIHIFTDFETILTQTTSHSTLTQGLSRQQ